MNYCVSQLNTLPTDVIRSFNELPLDKYLNHDAPFRARRYSTGVINSNKILWDTKPRQFFQAKNINRYIGGVTRDFAELNQVAKQYVLEELLPKVTERLPYYHFRFGVHQIRIKTEDLFMGKPAPEGIHQDGFDYIAVVCTSTFNITGGNSILVDADNYKKVVCDRILLPGEVLLFNDKKYAHYASPIVPRMPGCGHRDVFVLTFEEK